MGQVDPKFNFAFDVLSKGYHALEVKEAGIEPQGEGKTSGKRYWVRLAAIVGDQEGVSHIENFFEKTKNDFSFSKMAGLLYKLGVIKNLGKVDTANFLTPDFENRWKNGMNGKKMGCKSKYRYAENDKDKETPFSDLEQYLSYDEVMAILNKGGKQVEAPVASTETPATPAPWD